MTATRTSIPDTPGLTPAAELRLAIPVSGSVTAPDFGRGSRPRLKVRLGPDGIHLFNRETGANVLIDEARIPTALWAHAPRQVSVALTNACDLRCPYCYAPKHAASLDRDRVMAWLSELDANGCLGVGFGGGEPTLYRHLGALCRYAARNTGLAVSFTTHALRLGDKLAAELRENVHYIRVSMDGVDATYEKLRGRPFAMLRSRLAVVRQIAPFGINFVVNALTIPHLDAAVAIAHDAGATQFLLLPEQPISGRPGVDPRTLQALRDWVNAYRGPTPLAVSHAGAVGLPTCDPLPNGTGLRAYAHIDASGIVKASSFSPIGVMIDADGVIAAIRTLKMRAGGEP